MKELVVYPLVPEIKVREYLSWIHDSTDALDVNESIYIDGCHVNGLVHRAKKQ